MQTTKPRDTLPSNPDAEHALIGYLLKNYKRVPEIQEILPTPEAFSPGADREIFKAIMAVSAKGLEPDIYHVPVHLREIGSAVTTETLGNRMMNAPATGGIELAQFVLKSWVKREVLTKLDEARDKATRPGTELAELEGMISSAADCFLKGTPGHGSTDIQKIAQAVLANAMSGPQKRTITTPWDALNRITGGMHPGELIVPAGRPSTGKTALALNIAAATMFSGRSVGVFSLEMDNKALGQRLCAACEGIDAQVFRTGRFSQSDIQAIKRFEQKVHSLALKVADSPRADPDLIRAEARSWKRKGGLDLLLIDYLQLISPSAGRKESNREREVADITRGMKQLAVELQIPVVLLAQLNRGVEMREDKTPRLSDLRESGSIEQDADQVWFLTPWNTAQNEMDVVSVNLSVAKSRSSSTGSVKLEYHRRHLRFQEVTW